MMSFSHANKKGSTASSASTTGASLSHPPLSRSSPAFSSSSSTGGGGGVAVVSSRSPPSPPGTKPTRYGRDSNGKTKPTVEDHPFAIPDSPLNRRSLNHGGLSAPFPTAQTDETRHKVDDKSLEAWRYIMSIPGKNVRDQLIDAFQVWFRCEDDALVLIKQIVGALHSSSLLIDDVEDHSEKRRGFDAAHIVYGVDKTINAANYVYFLALEKVLMLQSTQAVEAYTHEMLNLHRGQGRDIWWRVDGHIATPDEYDQMVIDKTGGLFRLAIKLMSSMSPVMAARLGGSKRPLARSAGSLLRLDGGGETSDSEDSDSVVRPTALSEQDPLPTYLDLCNSLAVYFQIRDDLLNIASPEFHAKKGFCEDITEGKLSFPVLHTVTKFRATGVKADAAKVEDLLRILKSQTMDVAVKKRAIRIMCEAAAVEATVERLTKLRTKIERLIQELGGNPHLLKILSVLAADLDDCHHTMERVVMA